jgi:hypothetical protein
MVVSIAVSVACSLIQTASLKTIFPSLNGSLGRKLSRSGKIVAVVEGAGSEDDRVIGAESGKEGELLEATIKPFLCTPTESMSLFFFVGTPLILLRNADRPPPSFVPVVVALNVILVVVVVVMVVVVVVIVAVEVAMMLATSVPRIIDLSLPTGPRALGHVSLGVRNLAKSPFALCCSCGVTAMGGFEARFKLAGAPLIYGSSPSVVSVVVVVVVLVAVVVVLMIVVGCIVGSSDTLPVSVGSRSRPSSRLTKTP